MNEAGGAPARRRRCCRPLSLTTRLVLGYTLTTLAMISLVAVLLHRGIYRNFEVEDGELLSDNITTLRHLLAEHPGDMREARELVTESAATHQLEKLYGRLTDGEGRVLLETPGAAALLPPAPRLPAPLPPDQLPRLPHRMESPNGAPLFVSSVQVRKGRDESPLTYQVALDIHHLEHWMDGYRRDLILMCLASTAAAGLVGWLVTRGGLRPLQAITAAAQSVTAGGLSQAAPIGAQAWPRELSALALEFDRMLARLRQAFQRLSTFTADAAHEFRTPLNNLLGGTSLMLSRPRTIEDYRTLLESNAEEYQRLSQMVQSLLFLARADESGMVLKADGVDAAAAMREVLDFFSALAEEKGIVLTSGGEGTLQADPGLLRMALTNLVSNAIRHTPPGGRVTVTFQAEPGGMECFAVEDEGGGIAETHQFHVFERFYRVDASRTGTETGTGSGLGLAIVKTIMRLHGGEVRLRSHPPVGSVFELWFP
ncbi:MAG: heavy metal sensor histidine kinase [Verrucomicrobiaceae bacterium]|nr:MAG: heavy metal sensor histidine kinase [Verrucomicrobiaceae bacterium]